MARGCERVATIAGPLDVPAAQERLSGFQNAMAGHGRPYVPVVEGNFTIGSGSRAMERLLVEHPDLDGVFAANDLMAQGPVLVLTYGAPSTCNCQFPPVTLTTLPAALAGDARAR